VDANKYNGKNFKFLWFEENASFTMAGMMDGKFVSTTNVTGTISGSWWGTYNEKGVTDKDTVQYTSAVSEFKNDGTFLGENKKEGLYRYAINTKGNRGLYVDIEEKNDSIIEFGVFTGE
jgi:hypothetical protein